MKPQNYHSQTDFHPLQQAIVVGCPDARQPAYELVRSLAAAGYLNKFITGYYDKPSLPRSLISQLGSKGRTLDKVLARRTIDGATGQQVISVPSYDLLLRSEKVVGKLSSKLRIGLAHRRTANFDKKLAQVIPHSARSGAKVALFFSDVGSVHAMKSARKNGLKPVLSMVTGHMDEEMEILEREKKRSPEFFPAYLGDGSLDLDEMRWLHNRRRLDLHQADLVLVPSQHIAREVIRRSMVPADRVRVIPYAADPYRFQPQKSLSDPNSCRFLFAGGITQRKGLSDLLEAWKLIKRPGWSLSLAGEAPVSAQKLIPQDDPSLRLLGRIAYPSMPEVFANHDVFVFPSLFEGSAVVCYEAMAAGLAVITTPQSGSVVRHGEEGFIVQAAQPQKLAEAMKQLGEDFELRKDMGESARIRALDFTWEQYSQRTVQAIASLFAEEIPLPNPVFAS